MNNQSKYLLSLRKLKPYTMERFIIERAGEYQFTPLSVVCIVCIAAIWFAVKSGAIKHLIDKLSFND